MDARRINELIHMLLDDVQNNSLALQIKNACVGKKYRYHYTQLIPIIYSFAFLNLMIELLFFNFRKKIIFLINISLNYYWKQLNIPGVSTDLNKKYITG